jgi:anti-anti-sigma factor
MSEPAHLQFGQERVGDLLVLRLRAPLVADVIPALASTLDAVDDPALRRVQLDLARVPHVDSRGIGALVGWHRHFLVRGIEFRLINITEPVFRIFQVCNLTSLLNLGPEPATVAEQLALRRRMLSDSFEYGRRLLAALGQGVVGLDPDDRLLFVDDKAAELLGREESALIGSVFGDALSLEGLFPDRGQPLRDFVQRSLRHDGILREECRIETPAGTAFLALTVAATIHGESCIGAIMALQDIGARVRTEETLIESERRYRILAENVSDVIWTTDTNLNLTYISPSVERLRGAPPDQFIGTPVADMLTTASSSHAAGVLREQLKLESRGGADPERSAILELQTNRSPNAESWIEVHITFLRDAQGNPRGLLGITRDITDRKKSELERGRLQEKLLQSQKMEAIGTLAGGVAHDFNNLLTGILGHSSMILSRSGLDPEIAESASVIEEAARRGAELTTSLLGFARRGALARVPVDLDQCVRDLVRLLKPTLDRRIEITHRPAASSLTVMGDPAQLHHGLLNLALNARDAMPAGGMLTFATARITPSADQLAAHPDSPPGPYAELSVSDTGEGIAAPILGRIFEPFFSTREVGKGSGMGLAVVYGIAEHHKGWIEVASEPGNGSTFRLLLPLATEKVETPRPSRPVAGARVLVVDDEEIVRTLAARMLDRLGYQVAVAADGVEALEIYRPDPSAFDLVLLDMVMPRMGGKQCLAELRRINPEVRVIVSSGYSRSDAIEAGQDSGIAGFAQKPYRLQDLGAVVERALSNPD